MPPAPAPVPGPLRGLVTGVVGYDVREPGATVHRGLPGPALTLVLPLDQPLRTAAGAGDWEAGRVASQWMVLGGLHTTAAYVENPGRWRGIQLAVHPLAARRLFGLPASGLPTDAWDARDLLGDEHDRVVERLQAARSWPERHAVVTDFLLDRLADGDRVAPVRPEVTRAWQLLGAQRGGVGVEQLGREVGYSRRRLTQLFTEELGVAPTTAGRLMRFDAARKRVAANAATGRGLGLADLAADLGYVDQAHLAREFRQFAGLSPTRWLAAERGQDVPDVQDPAGRRVPA